MRQSSKEKCLEAVKACPGISAFQMSMPQRRCLRPLEKEGQIEYRDGGWHVKTRVITFANHGGKEQAATYVSDDGAERVNVRLAGTQNIVSISRCQIILDSAGTKGGAQ
jgi:hypothetical protein